MKNNEIIIFENQEVELEVNMKDETVWLSLDQMARPFDMVIKELLNLVELKK